MLDQFFVATVEVQRQRSLRFRVDNCDHHLGVTRHHAGDDELARDLLPDLSEAHDQNVLHRCAEGLRQQVGRMGKHDLSRGAACIGERCKSWRRTLGVGPIATEPVANPRIANVGQHVGLGAFLRHDLRRLPGVGVIAFIDDDTTRASCAGAPELSLEVASPFESGKALSGRQAFIGQVDRPFAEHAVVVGRVLHRGWPHADDHVVRAREGAEDHVGDA